MKISFLNFSCFSGFLSTFSVFSLLFFGIFVHFKKNHPKNRVINGFSVRKTHFLSTPHIKITN
ncbi:hypothetical protein [uncultured Gammaproteobacteria bacterium]|nr:hypothetical protein [uncultured Gammaproteobacteria bacterium]CAC9589416.1 hypothetical protein [uncultured Gammaproteobacteria bacterium]